MPRHRPETHTYTVLGRRGGFGFPLDMLRTSESWPADGESAVLIGKLQPFVIYNDQPEGRVKIKLNTIQLPNTNTAFEESCKRWSSFGWTVENPEYADAD